jgi:hypothetical protein
VSPPPVGGEEGVRSDYEKKFMQLTGIQEGHLLF